MLLLKYLFFLWWPLVDVFLSWCLGLFSLGLIPVRGGATYTLYRYVRVVRINIRNTEEAV